MRINIDCLSLSATPIPRSLNMALSGIRDISLLREAPHGRKDIKTTVSKFDE
jgi:transcription-repair coupling factor (superfamily II helicase)